MKWTNESFKDNKTKISQQEEHYCVHCYNFKSGLSEDTIKQHLINNHSTSIKDPQSLKDNYKTEMRTKTSPLKRNLPCENSQPNIDYSKRVYKNNGQSSFYKFIVDKHKLN